jgi:hypothetical protein
MIGQMSGRFARAGAEAFLSFMAILSVNLAILNLLPIPVLDGGHLVFLGIEAVRGRPLSMEQRMRFTQVGFVLIIMLMAWAIGNDLLRADRHLRPDARRLAEHAGAGRAASGAAADSEQLQLLRRGRLHVDRAPSAAPAAPPRPRRCSGAAPAPGPRPRRPACARCSARSGAPARRDPGPGGNSSRASSAGRAVRQVAVAGRNALLHRPRVRSRPQQRVVVVRFQDEHVAAGQFGTDRGRRSAQVRGDAEARAGVVSQTVTATGSAASCTVRNGRTCRARSRTVPTSRTPGRPPPLSSATAHAARVRAVR